VILAEAAVGARVRQVRPDGELWDAHGVIEHTSGLGALVRWAAPAQPEQTWVPNISWLVLDEGEPVPDLGAHADLPDPVHGGDVFSRIEASQEG
jgi:hypothetical protein